MRKPTLLTIFLTVFLDLVGFGIVMPLLQIYGRDQAGAGKLTGLMIGVIISSYSLMQFLFAPAWGRLSDRIGRRPVLLVSLFGSTVSYLIFAFAKSWEWVLVSRVFAGVCGANIAVAQAYIADITTRENRAKGMGLIGMAFGLGFILGPVIGGIAVGKEHHYIYAGLIAATLCGINFILAIFHLPESLDPARAREAASARTGRFTGLASVLRHGVMARLLAVTFLANVAFAIWESTFGQWLNVSPAFHYGMREFGYLLAWTGFISAFMQGGAVGRLVQRFGAAPLLKISVLVFAATSVALPFCGALAPLLVVLAVLALANGVNRPVLSTLLSLNATPSEQGLVLGLSSSCASLARIVGPPAGGALFDLHLPSAAWAGHGALPFLAASASLLIAWILVLRLHDPPTPSPDPQPQPAHATP
jgi:multidrug resistance protein